MKKHTTVMSFFATKVLYIVLGITTLYFIWYFLIVELVLLAVLALFSVMVARVIKRFIGKRRHEGRWLPVSGYAFPSTHATGLASLLVSTYGDIIFYIIFVGAVIILFGRVTTRVHDYKDIIAGLLLGTFVTGGLLYLLTLLISL
jgi:membrane-associated phospholipid phosphatase